MDRTRIILIPNVAAWIIGEMSKHIMAQFCDRFDFYFVPEVLLYRRPDLVRALLPGANLIHCMNESATALLVEKLGFRPDYPPILTWIHHVTRWSAEHEIAARYSRALISCTPGWAKTISGYLSQQIPVHPIRHGVDTTFFRPRQDTRTRFGIPPQDFVAAFIAHKGSDLDNERKGFRTLVAIARRVAPEIPNFRLLLVGPGWEQNAAELRAEGVRTDHLGFLPRSEVPLLFAAINAYIMTARVEGGPCTVLESMACGTPVVATRVGLVPDVIADGLNSFSAEVDDVPALSQRLLSIAADPAKARLLGQRARATAEQNTWARNLEPFADIYRRYSSPSASQVARRSWLRNPAAFTGPAHAADSIANAWDQIRRQPGRAPAILQMMRYSLEGISVADCVRGAALLKGLAFRT